MNNAGFDGFDFNQLMNGNGAGSAGNGYVPQQQSQQPSGDNMFDFAPPSNGNFDFAPNAAGNGNSFDSLNTNPNTPRGNPNTAVDKDFGSVDNFGGNLNSNFDDPYLGDPNLMMGGGSGGNSGNGGGGSGNDANGNNFGFGDQQVPSEIVNLNNAFGAGPNQGSGGGAPDDLSNMVLNGLGQQQQQPQQPMMDFGEFGAASQNPTDPFGFNF